MRHLIAIAATGLLATACVHSSTIVTKTMRGPDGTTVRCSAVGRSGILAISTAEDAHRSVDQCMEDYKRAGYVDPSAPVPVTVTSAMLGGVEERGGVRLGDIVRSVSGTSVANEKELAAIIARSQGKSITLTVERGGQLIELPPVTPQ